ncbi:inositol 2-dehydrogenase [Crystallibacter degradans]|uniref:inositol 2-dehydrogenase n=1 Tax=Crystallibacter degradans TaxID=2726743 RepID=UPI003211F260
MASHTGAGRPLRLGLIGSGRIGAVHAASLAAHPGVDFAWVADPFIESARGLAAMYGATATESVEQVLEDRSVDGVILCSPTPTHVDLILAAAERDVAVLCEKPVDLDLERARSCQRAVAGAARPIMIGFNRRFDPSFAAVRRRVDAGEIGRLEQLAITCRDPEPAPEAYIRTSGGIFRDMTIHDFDMARFFLPDIVQVSAHGSNLFNGYIRDAGDYDSAVVVLIGAGGEQVTITNSRHSAYGYDQRLEAFGAGGMLSAENFRPTSVRSYSSAGTEQADAYEPFFLERYAAAYRAELEHFLRCIREDESATPGIGDGVAALELAEAAAHSAVTGRTVAVGGAAAVGPAAATRATESRG